MAKNELTTTFDYSVVTDEQQSALIYYAAEIQKSKNAMAEQIVGIGETLTSAQNELSNHKGGVFVQWLELECGFSKSTAYRCMAAYNVFGSFPNLGKLEVSALYVLSENSTPKKAIKSAKKLVDRGVNVTHATAKKLIKEASENGESGGTASPPPAPPPPAPEATRQDNDSFGPIDDVDDPFGEEEPPPATTTDTPESSPSESGGVGSGSSSEEIKTQRAKTVKTVEALIRCFDDMNEICESDDHDWVIRDCQNLLNTAKGWG